MNWSTKRVLVTGAGGFIGSHLTEKLVLSGAKVRSFVHYNASGTWGWLDTSSVLNDIEVVSGDITDRDSVFMAMKDIDIIFHLAALIAIPYSYTAPASYVNTNINGTLNLLQSARQLNIEKFVHTSSSEVYGTALYTPIDEKHPLQGQSPYSATKIGADKLAESFHLSFNLPVITIRPFNTFGPRQSARAVIPTIITQCKTGDKVKLGNLNPSRDLNYVSNTVDGFLLAASTKKAIGETINLGYGDDISIGNLAKLIISIINKNIHIESDDIRKRPENSEVDQLLADNKKARQLLGWEPKVSLRQGLIKTIEWIEDNMEKYRPDIYSI